MENDERFIVHANDFIIKDDKGKIITRRQSNVDIVQVNENKIADNYQEKLIDDTQKKLK